MAEKLPSALLLRTVDLRFYRVVVGDADAQQTLGGGRAKLRRTAQAQRSGITSKKQACAGARKLTRVTLGVNLPLSEVMMSRCLSLSDKITRKGGLPCVAQ